ncbi:Hsp33 family molecular chaperone [Rhizobiaceae bacterium]|nr:Hsp33 family molecular chaperone [Rhizobiaceae bacterium]
MTPSTTLQDTDSITLSGASFAGPDHVVPFAVEALDVRGRSVQVGPMLDQILSRHDYPEPVARLLAEAVVLTVLLGSALKFEGKFILQTQTDGPVSMLVVDYRTPGSVRAYAKFATDVSFDAPGALQKANSATLLGNGTLAMTIDQGQYTQRYQGIVQLDGIGLEEVARRYFRQSEQIPTEVRLAVAERLTRNEGDKPTRNWVAGGVLAQFLPDNSERMRQRDLHGGDGAPDDDGNIVEDDFWAEATALMGTIGDDELTDAAVEPERLLFRLFHEQGVRVFDAVPVLDNCACSRERVSDVLGGLSEDERSASVEDGEIVVTCEFCSTRYTFEPGEFDADG